MKPEKCDLQIQRETRGRAHEADGAGAHPADDLGAHFGDAGTDGEAPDLDRRQPFQDAAREHVRRNLLCFVDEQPGEQDSGEDKENDADQCDEQRRDGGRQPPPHEPVVQGREQHAEDGDADDPRRVGHERPHQRGAQSNDDERGALVLGIEKRHLLAAALHAQDPAERLAVHRDADQVVARCHDRCATQSSKSSAATSGYGRPAERLGDESERAEAAAPAATACPLSGAPQQGRELTEETGVRRGLTTLRPLTRGRRGGGRGAAAGGRGGGGAGAAPPGAGARGVVSPGRSTNRPVAGVPPKPPPPPPPGPPPPKPNRCARPCTSAARSAAFIGSSICALPPALASESNTKLIRATSHTLSRFWDGDSVIGGGCFPWKFQTTRCRPAPAGPCRVRIVSPETSVITMRVRARRSPLPDVRRYAISAPYGGLGARKAF